MMSAVLITGTSGSGKSVALRMLEDSGYLCVDNLPVHFLCEFLTKAQTDGIQRVAVAIDARSPNDIAQLPEALNAVRAMGIPLRVVFLDASTPTLIQRYSESRRRHPLTDRIATDSGCPPSLQECIATERELLGPLRDEEYVIDTTGTTPGQLRAWIRELVHVEPMPLVLTFESFAYKAGAPIGADLVFDARCLPNPHYDPQLRRLTGRDPQVIAWLEQRPIVRQMVDDIAQFLAKWLPHYAQDTRAYLTVAIGCTGGQHRSVYIVEELARRFRGHGQVLVRHRAQTGPDFIQSSR